jgi:hypothetical protein
MSVEGNEGFLEIPNASLRVSGNVHAEGIKLGVVELIPSYDLASVSNVGNTTTQTVQFTNPTTSLVASSNIVMLNTANTAQNVELSVGENTNVYTRMSYLNGDKLNYHESGDYFGRSVSLSGDGKVAAVASPWDDDVAVDSGAVFVFVQNSMGEWNRVQKLKANDASNYIYLGGIGTQTDQLRGVSISGDGSIIVAGSSYNDPNGTDSGAAYVFEKSGSTWTQFQKIVASDGAASDHFGASVSVSRDGSTIAVGSPYDDTTTDQGAAYIFEKVGGTWTQVQKIVQSDTLANTSFGGTGVELTDDGTTILVGASFHDTGGQNTGRAYIFDKAANGTWSQTQILRASNGGASDQFASGIGISGDGTVICCGAYGEDTGATNKGAAYIFVKSAAGAWSQTETQIIQASDGTTSDFFGLGVSVSQNGDRILVGAYMDDTTEGDSGSMYIFDRTNGVWTQTNHLYPGHATAPGGYGMSSAISDDGKVYMVGSPNDETAGGTDNGAVFVYDEKIYIERKNYIGLRCPVLFSASSQGIDYAGGSGSSATIIKWNIVYRNWGGGYDPKTGIFTAPIAGYYKFDTFLNSADVGVHWFRFSWFKNGNIYQPHYEPGAYEDDHKSISGSIVVDLEVGDTFDVRVTYNTMYAGHGNGFTGFYLSP